MPAGKGQTNSINGAVTASNRCNAAKSCSPSSIPSVSPCSDAAEMIVLPCNEEIPLAPLLEEYPLVEARLVMVERRVGDS